MAESTLQGYGHMCMLRVRQDVLDSRTRGTPCAICSMKNPAFEVQVVTTLNENGLFEPATQPQSYFLSMRTREILRHRQVNGV